MNDQLPEAEWLQAEPEDEPGWATKLAIMAGVLGFIVGTMFGLGLAAVVLKGLI